MEDVQDIVTAKMCWERVLLSAHHHVKMQKEGPYWTTDVDTLILNFSVSKSVRNLRQFYRNYPTCGHFLVQHRSAYDIKHSLQYLTYCAAKHFSARCDPITNHRAAT